MKTLAILVVLLISPSCLARTKPLSVCDVLKKPVDWNNNIVLLRAHYGQEWKTPFCTTSDARAKKSGSIIQKEQRRKTH